MRQRSAPGTKSRAAFKIVSLAALLAAIGQVSLGGVVRVTGSGLGCPDWPLCHGQIIPPFELTTLIEYSHRLTATLVGVLVLATLVLAWRLYRSRTWILTPSIAGMVLVIAAAALGGATVLTDLAWGVRLVHLAIAEALVASMVLVTVGAWTVSSASASAAVDGDDASGLSPLLKMSLVGVFVLILSGSYMVGRGAGSSCSSWPLCVGAEIPGGEAYAIHMAHRIVSGLVGLVVFATAMYGWMLRAQRPGLGPASVALAALFLAQVLVGAGTVWSGFSTELRVTHLAMATVAWSALALVAALTFVPSWTAQPGAARRGVAGLGEAAS